MKFYIKEWSEKTVVLMTDNGHVLSYFTSISEAINACAEWYNSNETEQKHEVFVQYKQAKAAYAPAATLA